MEHSGIKATLTTNSLTAAKVCVLMGEKSGQDGSSWQPSASMSKLLENGGGRGKELQQVH